MAFCYIAVAVGLLVASSTFCGLTLPAVVPHMFLFSEPTTHVAAVGLQVAVSLAETFQQVVAQDSSASQIAAAQQRPNIRYEQAPAEASGLPEGCVDLITAAQCMHWCGGRGGGGPRGWGGREGEAGSCRRKLQSCLRLSSYQALLFQCF